MPPQRRTLLFTGYVGLHATFNNRGADAGVFQGQGSYQISLLKACQNPSVDIVNLAFINEFPSKIGDYPGDNFGMYWQRFSQNVD